MPVEVSWATAVAPRWNDGGLAGGGERLENAFVGIEAFVGDQQVGLHTGQQVIGPGEIVRLASGQQEPERVAESVDQGVDLGAQPAARAPERLVRAVFFLAPALC